MRLGILSAAASALIAGCALRSVDCGPDWYALGERDGRLGANPQVAFYAAQCAAPVDEALYARGWQDGFAQRPPPGW